MTFPMQYRSAAPENVSYVHPPDAGPSQKIARCAGYLRSSPADLSVPLRVFITAKREATEICREQMHESAPLNSTPELQPIRHVSLIQQSIR